MTIKPPENLELPESPTPCNGTERQADVRQRYKYGSELVISTPAFRGDHYVDDNGKIEASGTYTGDSDLLQVFARVFSGNVTDIHETPWSEGVPVSGVIDNADKRWGFEGANRVPGAARGTSGGYGELSGEFNTLIVWGVFAENPCFIAERCLFDGVDETYNIASNIKPSAYALSFELQSFNLSDSVLGLVFGGLVQFPQLLLSYDDAASAAAGAYCWCGVDVLKNSGDWLLSVSRTGAELRAGIDLNRGAGAQKLTFVWRTTRWNFCRRNALLGDPKSPFGAALPTVYLDPA